MGHVSVGHHWDRVTMDILDVSVTTPKGNQYVLVIVDCFSRWTEACPLPNKTALAVADVFFQLIVLSIRDAGCQFIRTRVGNSKTT